MDLSSLDGSNQSNLHLSKIIKKKYWINTNLDDEIIDLNFKRVLRSVNKSNKQNVNYFRSFLKHFYDYEICENEMEILLQKIRTIKYSIKRDFIEFTKKDGKKIHKTILSNNHFYSKKTSDFCVFLYKTNYENKEAVIKVYQYYPKYVFSLHLMEDRFENEIIFQTYANSLNEEIDFISPEIYSFGKISIEEDDDNIDTNYLFIIMEYIDGIRLKHLDFTPELCKKIYEIDKKLKHKLLNHNDIQSRNIIISEKNDFVLLDYGESVHCI